MDKENYYKNSDEIEPESQLDLKANGNNCNNGWTNDQIMLLLDLFLFDIESLGNIGDYEKQNDDNEMTKPD